MTRPTPASSEDRAQPIPVDGKDGEDAKDGYDGKDGKGSGEGADTALEALIRKRKELTPPDDLADRGTPPDALPDVGGPGARPAQPPAMPAPA
jgi:hypothetical protein